MAHTHTSWSLQRLNLKKLQRNGPSCLHGRTASEETYKQHYSGVCLSDYLAGPNDPAFAALKVRYADVLGGTPPGMPQDRGVELELEMGDAPMPRSRKVKR